VRSAGVVALRGGIYLLCQEDRLVGKRWKDNALSIVIFGLFLLFWVGHSLAGWAHHNQEQRDHGQPTIGWSAYVRTGDFLESTFENWESEFFQMACFIVLSAKLVQRGSAESKKPEEERDPGERDDHDADPAEHVQADSPKMVQRGGLMLKVYSHSLGLALTALFLVSFALHAVTGVQRYNEDAQDHGQPGITLLRYLGSSTFWFESLQNWQSEFLSVGALIVLSIFLREKGSPESKPVHVAHAETGAG
jgi:hypothetical protein